ncbi:MAG: ROK family protein [Geminicoccaceae bacterium]
MSATLAIDMGGTKILAALVDGASILERRTVPTRRDDGADAWIEQIAGIASAWKGRYGRIGVAVTGVVDDGAWSALNPGTLDIPDRYPLARRVETLFGMTPVLANDAQAAALGEARHGAGNGGDMVFLTVSTGIGGGVVANGRLLAGRGGMSGSFGQLIDANGVRIEDRASGRGMMAAARRRGHDADARAIFAAAAAGKDWASEIIDEAVSDVADLCRNLQFAFDPPVIVIGGGVGLADGYLERLRAHLSGLRKQLRPTLVAAQLGGDAGVIGVAELTRDAAGSV